MNPKRVMVITGASSGIGRALAERAAGAGCDVFAVGRDRERLASLESTLALATGSVTTLALELRMRGAAQRIARGALERYGRIDVLVNAAGAVAAGPISMQSDAALREQLEVHVLVPLALVRESLTALRASRGHVFFFGSGVARIPVGNLGAYPSAKAAVRSMARVVRNELGAYGIAVTYVDPGAVATEFMTRAGFAGPPAWIAASPYAVASRIFAATRTRRDVVNAVPWQTFFVALGEALPKLTDYLLARNPELAGATPSLQSPVVSRADTTLEPPADATAGTAVPAQSTETQAAVSAEPAPPQTPPAPSELETALAELLPRMRRLKLSLEFVAGLLEPGATLEVGGVAMRWAGMPNKNERGLARDVLETLIEAGYLARRGDDEYAVIRTVS